MAKDIPRGEEVSPTLGYWLVPTDGGYNPVGDYSGDEWPPSAPACAACGSLVDFDYVPPNVRVKGNWDIVEADGRTIVNERFREFCLGAGIPPGDFRLVNVKRRFYELWPQAVLQVDLERSKPQFGKFCTKCGSCTECTLGPGLFFASTPAPLKDGFYRTDLMFGGAKEKAPAIIVTPHLAQELTKAKFRRALFMSLMDLEFAAASLGPSRKELAEERRLRALSAENEGKQKGD